MILERELVIFVATVTATEYLLGRRIRMALFAQPRLKSYACSPADFVVELQVVAEVVMIRGFDVDLCLIRRRLDIVDVVDIFHFYGSKSEDQEVYLVETAVVNAQMLGKLASITGSDYIDCELTSAYYLSAPITTSCVAAVASMEDIHRVAQAQKVVLRVQGFEDIVILKVADSSLDVASCQ